MSVETINDLMGAIQKAYSKLDSGLRVFINTPYDSQQSRLTILLSNNRRMCLHRDGDMYGWDMSYVRKFFRITRKLLHRQLLDRIDLKLTDIWAD